MRIRYGGNLQSPSARARLQTRREPYWVVIVRGCALGYRRGASGGTWIARRRGDDGKQHYQALGSADDLNDGNGLSYRDAFEQARRLFGAPSPSSSKLTVGGALDRYLEYVKAKKPESTAYDTEKRIEAIIRPKLGDLRLSKLSADNLRRFLNELREDRAPDTVNRIWAILKAALNLSWRDRLVADDSAWRLIRAERIKGTARKVFLSAEQSKRLLEHATPVEFRDLVAAGLVTGARLGELLALRARDLDPATGTVEMRGKTGSRTVYLSEEALALFVRLAEGKDPDAILLPKEGDVPWGENHHHRRFARVVKAAKLDPRTVFYSLRHTHISLALKAGVNIQVLAENCGTSVRMIEKHYGKFLRQDRRAMFDRIPELVRESA